MSAKYRYVYYRVDLLDAGRCEVSIQRDNEQDSLSERLGVLGRPSDGHTIFENVNEAQECALAIQREEGRVGGVGIGIYLDGNLISQRNIDQFEPS